MYFTVGGVVKPPPIFNQIKKNMFEIIGIIVFVIVLAFLLEYEKGTESTLLIGVGCIALYYIPQTSATTRSILDFVFSNPGLVAAMVFVYITCGIIYAFIKWYYLIKDFKKAYPSAPLIQYPKAKDRTGDILRWTSYWIFNFWITLIHRPLLALVERLGHSFDALTKKIVEN